MDSLQITTRHLVKEKKNTTVTWNKAGSTLALQKLLSQTLVPALEGQLSKQCSLILLDEIPGAQLLCPE